jgi:endonuclease YncB( thermonuclease family)
MRKEMRSVARFLYLVSLFAFVSFLRPSLGYAQNRVTGQVVAVEAGDVIQVRVDDWTVTVRLHGVLCSETPPELAQRAKEYVERRVAATRVKVEVRGTGPKQTLYGEVQAADGRSLNGTCRLRTLGGFVCAAADRFT